MLNKIGCLLFFSFYVMAVFADAPAEELSQKLNNLQTMQANFEQTVLDNNGTTLQKTRGQMALQRPGKFRWQTQQPIQQLIIADGKNIWLYDADLAQVTKKRQNAAQNNTPAMLLSGSVTTLVDSFTIKRFSKTNSALLWYRLSPKDENNLFQIVQLGFDKDKLQEMRITSNLGQESVLRFSNIQINPPLNPSLFRFVIPSGTDVIAE